MKKFYESPIVEITVFDVEDVITASVNTAGDTANMEKYIDAVRTDLNANDVTSAAEVYDFSSYKW